MFGKKHKSSLKTLKVRQLLRYIESTDLNLSLPDKRIFDKGYNDFKPMKQSAFRSTLQNLTTILSMNWMVLPNKFVLIIKLYNNVRNFYRTAMLLHIYRTKRFTSKISVSYPREVPLLQYAYPTASSSPLMQRQLSHMLSLWQYQL